MQAIHAYGLPLALLFTDRLVRQPHLRDACCLALAMSLMVQTSGYLVVFGVVAIALALVARIGEWWGRRRAVLAGLALAAITTAIVALPVVIWNRRVATDQGMVRAVESVRQFSATASGYLAATGRLHVSTWSERFYTNPVDTFFPGIVAILLAAFCVWSTLRKKAPAPLVVMLVCIGAAGFVLSLG